MESTWGVLQAVLLTCAVLAFVTSEALALLHPDRNVNSLVQYLATLTSRRLYGAAIAVGGGLLALFLLGQYGSATLLANGREATHARQVTDVRCSLDGIANRSFVGSWLGRTTILHVERVDRTADGGTFQYVMRLGSEGEIRGSGIVDGRTCDVVLSSFDSRGRLVRRGTSMALESVEPSWRLVASTRALVP